MTHETLAAYTLIANLRESSHETFFLVRSQLLKTHETHHTRVRSVFEKKIICTFCQKRTSIGIKNSIEMQFPHVAENVHSLINDWMQKQIFVAAGKCFYFQPKKNLLASSTMKLCRGKWEWQCLATFASSFFWNVVLKFEKPWKSQTYIFAHQLHNNEIRNK